LEQLPVSDGSVDAVTSNCVINLVPDKPVVFREIARVLRPGGRLVISDVVLDGDLPAGLESDLLAWAGCVAGAMRRERYLEAVEAAGLRQVELLSDVDMLAAFGDSLPPDIAGLAEERGIDLASLAGMVRSITYRAHRPS
jgi:SAM-dependent methyltransferase